MFFFGKQAKKPFPARPTAFSHYFSDSVFLFKTTCKKKKGEIFVDGLSDKVQACSQSISTLWAHESDKLPITVFDRRILILQLGAGTLPSYRHYCTPSYRYKCILFAILFLSLVASYTQSESIRMAMEKGNMDQNMKRRDVKDLMRDNIETKIVFTNSNCRRPLSGIRATTGRPLKSINSILLF